MIRRFSCPLCEYVHEFDDTEQSSKQTAHDAIKWHASRDHDINDWVSALLDEKRTTQSLINVIAGHTQLAGQEWDDGVRAAAETIYAYIGNEPTEADQRAMELVQQMLAALVPPTDDTEQEPE